MAEIQRKIMRRKKFKNKTNKNELCKVEYSKKILEKNPRPDSGDSYYMSV